MNGDNPAPLAGDPNEEPRVTPGLIVSVLSNERLAEVARRLDMPVPGLAARESHMHDHMTRRLLAQLTAEELRRVAALAGVPADGQFVDLYRRLARLC
jgi:hypothetical protein